MKEYFQKNYLLQYKQKLSSRGFTLIELLAVIAILAILVMVAMPTVIRLYNDAQKRMFVTQVQNFYKAAEQQYMINSLHSENIDRHLYTRIVEENKLSTSGSKKIYYDIELNDGKIIKVMVSNDKFSISKENENKIFVNDIVKADVKEKNEEGYIDVGSGITYIAKVYGAQWDGTSNSLLTRTDDAVGLTYQVNESSIRSDFNNADIYKEMKEVTDSFGNSFIKIPKFYIKKTVVGNTWKWQISKQNKDGNYYLPACFTDESTGEIYPYILVGKYDASLSTDGTKLESKSGKEVLVNKTIDEFRNYAKANGSGYQLLDIHIIDMLQVLFTIEYATLDSQSVMQGFTAGIGSDISEISSVGTNSITLSSEGSEYKVGQMIDIAIAWPNSDIAKNLKIKSISNNTITYEEVSGLSQIFETIDSSHIVYNVPYITGSTNVVSTASGSPVSNTNGDYSMKYRGIENLYGNIWQFIDGINIRNRVSYVAKDPKQYDSTIFTEPYYAIGYTNANTNNDVTRIGYDSTNPFVNLPVSADIEDNSAYKDFYYQDSGDRIALFGGSLDNIQLAGIWNWSVSLTSTISTPHLGARLIKTDS